MNSDLRIPSGLRAHAIWRAEESRGSQPGVVFATDLKRRRIFIGFAAVAVVLAVYALVLGVGRESGRSILFMALAVVLLAIGVYFHYSGKTGFYEVSESGELGKFLGRRPPVLSGKRQRLG